MLDKQVIDRIALAIPMIVEFWSSDDGCDVFIDKKHMPHKEIGYSITINRVRHTVFCCENQDIVEIDVARELAQKVNMVWGRDIRMLASVRYVLVSLKASKRRGNGIVFSLGMTFCQNRQ